MVIGVLAVQGAFEKHAEVLRDIGHEVALIRQPRDLAGIEGLVFPGGESTVQLDLLGRLSLEGPLCELLARNIPTFATCAGLILLAKRLRGSPQRCFGFIDVTVERNAWGRQIDSFEARSDHGRELVFIRAPRIVEVGPRATVLDTYEREPVLVRDGNVVAATFHPELTSSHDVHTLAFASRHSAGVVLRQDLADRQVEAQDAR